jgi:adhesin transport system outer membrane protein
MQKLAILPMIMFVMPVEALTLEQSVAEALLKNPRLIESYARFEAKYKDKRGAFSDYLPQVRLYAGIGYENVSYNSGIETDTELTRRELGLRVTQSLFEGFKTNAEVARLDYEMRADRQKLLSDAENLSLEVAEVYLDYLKAVETTGLSQRNVKDHRKVLNDIQSRQEKGLSSAADVAQVQARLATSQSAFFSSKNNQFDLKAKYYDLVGSFPSDMHVPKADADFLPNNLAEALNEARSTHPEISAAIMDINAANKQVDREKSGYWPKFNLQLDVNDNENVGGYEGPDDDARVMLTMNYDLYSGGRTTAKTEAAAWRKEEAIAIKNNTHRQIIEGTTLAWNAHRFIGQQKKFYIKNVDFATEAEAGYRQQFNLGKRSLLDVLDSKVELFVARKNYIDATFDERKSSYRLINATGKLIAALRVDTPKAWQLAEDNGDNSKIIIDRLEGEQQTDQAQKQHALIDASQIDNQE